MRIRLFGELDISVEDERPPALESGRARSLLAYLVLHDGEPQARQRLAFLLWPDSAEGQARTNLRHVLHTLRSAGPAMARFLDVTPQTLRWHGEGGCWTDVAAFDAALARATAAEPAGDEELAALREAVELYGGDLLDGCYDEWLLEERDRFRDRYLWALRRLAGLLAGRRNHGEALRLGRELLRLDPLREDSYRLLMRIHEAAGDRAGAVRTYHACASTLRRELAVDPSEETRRAYAALMRPGAESAPEPAPEAAAGATLVGREDEWRRLIDAWAGARAGRAQLVVVTGEPGIGKTRLVEDLATWCARGGAVVAQGRSYPGEGDLGYGVVLSWLRAPEVAAHVRQAPPADRAALARLLPELGPVDAGGGDAAEMRRRLFDAVARALVGPGRPTVLVADDAQWCDEESLRAIHYLVRLEPSPPVLVVATVRREDLADSHPLGALLGGLQAIDRASEVALDRLQLGETAALAELLAGRRLDPTGVEGLHAETEGNPLFIVETLRAGWPGSPAAVSPRLQAVITARLRQVSDPARAVLGVAATVGRQFTAGVLAGASSVDDTLVASLDELWRRGLIREQGTDAYDFAHGRIRDVAYDALPPAERRHNHLRIARTLASDPGARPGEVARHYEHAGRPEEAVAWYRTAATAALRLDANTEAVRLLDRARELVAALPEGPGRQGAELAVLSALPTPLSVVEGFASPRLAEVQRRVLELAGQTGEEPDSQLLRSVVMSNLCRRDFDAARAVATRLRQSASAGDDDVLLVESEYLLGIGAFWAGDFEVARRHFETVDRRFEPALRAEHLVRFGHDPQVVCVSRLANTLWFLGQVDGAREARDRAVATAEELRHTFSRGVVSIFACLLAVDMAEPATYGRYLGAIRDAAGQQALDAAAEAYMGYADVLDGRTGEGLRRIRTAVRRAPADHAPAQQATYYRLLVAAHDIAGDAEGGLRAAEEALGAPGTTIWHGEHRRLRDRFLAALGEER